ncbi:uncharacterized protein L201_003183 [Kwoniella dendrophila CBS 6074]|uniref:PWI domain-containing protein n=1 Tax=Kwoniella dendrophila CBS 6074 TaxID=1295534 RepID=A0AAX4JS36_9TREE
MCESTSDRQILKTVWNILNRKPNDLFGCPALSLKSVYDALGVGENDLNIHQVISLLDVHTEDLLGSTHEVALKSVRKGEQKDYWITFSPRLSDDSESKDHTAQPKSARQKIFGILGKGFGGKKDKLSRRPKDDNRLSYIRTTSGQATDDEEIVESRLPQEEKQHTMKRNFSNNHEIFEPDNPREVTFTPRPRSELRPQRKDTELDIIDSYNYASPEVLGDKTHKLKEVDVRINSTEKDVREKPMLIETNKILNVTDPVEKYNDNNRDNDYKDGIKIKSKFDSDEKVINPKNGNFVSSHTHRFDTVQTNSEYYDNQGKFASPTTASHPQTQQDEIDQGIQSKEAKNISRNASLKDRSKRNEEELSECREHREHSHRTSFVDRKRVNHHDHRHNHHHHHASRSPSGGERKMHHTHLYEHEYKRRTAAEGRSRDLRQSSDRYRSSRDGERDRRRELRHHHRSPSSERRRHREDSRSKHKDGSRAEHKDTGDSRRGVSFDEEETKTPFLMKSFEGLPFEPDTNFINTLSWMKERWQLVLAELIAVLGMVYIIQATGL